MAARHNHGWTRPWQAGRRGAAEVWRLPGTGAAIQRARARASGPKTIRLESKWYAGWRVVGNASVRQAGGARSAFSTYFRGRHESRSVSLRVVLTAARCQLAAGHHGQLVTSPAYRARAT